MEGCKACLIDALKVILFSAGQDGWGSVVSSYPILPPSPYTKAKTPSSHAKKIEGRSIFHGARPAKMI